MTRKIIYFTASAVPTAQELAAIDTLNALGGQQYQVNVSNATVDSGLGGIEASDFVAGSAPTDYSAVPVFDVNNPPRPASMIAAQAVVYDGQALVIGATTYTFTVTDGVITAITAA
jgi:hypothetical protein